MKSTCKLEAELRNAIEEVNRTLNIYEIGYISVPRYIEEERETVSSFKQFIEARFNYECRNIPELKYLIEETQGHLFFCVDLEEPDEKRRRFKTAHISLLSPDMLYEESEFLIDEINRVRELIGGTKISFSCLKKKFKITIN